METPSPSLKPASAASSSSVISIEVDGSGNLVLHKSSSAPDLQTESRTVNAGGLVTNKISSLAKVSRKYHRRSKEEPKKEARLLHYCPICNKGFKDRYSVNVHVRTHTGEKPFSCALCGKCFRQKAHLAKHHQTHAAKQNTGSSGLMKSSDTTTLSPGSKQTVVNQVSHLNAEDKIVFPLSPVSVEIM